MVFKQVIVVRTDLGMGKGKIAAQCAHASLQGFLAAGKKAREAWLASGSEKIVVKVSSEKELREIERKARELKLPCALVRDAGFTQIPRGSLTALAIGPVEEEKVDLVTGSLKLL